ncbi:hypothetical protein Glove_287g12 [Diversispora epigaea]|uniref:SURF1-like protein n=1 Tax=Diversispora epigaea TaxID=1348612 RepID=A0A397I7Q9_9GLOM|nr:hypothetical protein Glove_287g12 [Diversispora epigaea]
MLFSRIFSQINPINSCKNVKSIQSSIKLYSNFYNKRSTGQFLKLQLTNLSKNILKFKQFRRNYTINNIINHEYKKTKTNKTLFTQIILILAPIITFGLGTWQVQRLRWKVGLIEEYEDRLSKSPIILPKNIKIETLPEYFYRRVKTFGKFRHDQEMLIGPRTLNNNLGYYVITPLERENGTTILVKRGWISRDKIDSLLRRNDQNELVSIEGLLKNSEKKSWFTPKNEPDQNRWIWNDIENMAERIGAQPVLIEQNLVCSPHLINQTIQDGIPVGKIPIVDLRNTHLQYAITWYSLSLATSIMLYFLFKKPPDGHVVRQVMKG